MILTSFVVGCWKLNVYLPKTGQAPWIREIEEKVNTIHNFINKIPEFGPKLELLLSKYQKEFYEGKNKRSIYASFGIGPSRKTNSFLKTINEQLSINNQFFYPRLIPAAKKRRASLVSHMAPSMSPVMQSIRCL